MNRNNDRNDALDEALLLISSDDRLPDTLYNNAQFVNTSDIVKQQIREIGLKSFHIENSIQNINQRNDNITFHSDVSGLDHNVSIPNFNYQVPALMTTIQASLNSVSGASLITFTITQINLSQYSVSATGAFRFLSSSHIDRASPLSGLFITVNSTTLMTVIARGIYSRYIDVLIGGLKVGQVLENTFTTNTKFNNFQHLYRINMAAYTDQNVTKNEVTLDRDIENIHYTDIRSRNLKEITIELFDEFGDILFAPTQILGGDIYQINYLKYLFVISLRSKKIPNRT